MQLNRLEVHSTRTVWKKIVMCTIPGIHGRKLVRPRERIKLTNPRCF